MTLSYGHSGETKRAKNWTIRAFGFVQRGKAWIESGSYMDDIENMIDKQLQKWWNCCKLKEISHAERICLLYSVQCFILR